MTQSRRKAIDASIVKSPVDLERAVSGSTLASLELDVAKVGALGSGTGKIR